MCDTFVILPSHTADGSMIFGKNSDREPNEAQALEYRPAVLHVKGSVLRCTHIEIPQVDSTFAVLLSRPFWMWGAEIGANEKGVVIGNEAVWSKMPLIKKSGLTGMDLLRLGLERAGSAQQALEVMTDLMALHGQGGNGGYGKKFFYHNSFLIADPREAWVLEAAGPVWAALKLRDYYSISNGLTIGEEYDLAHPDLVTTARSRGWLKKGQTFHFSRVYSDWFYTTFSACRTRRNRSAKLLEEHEKTMDKASAFEILRDHGEEDYCPDSHLLEERVCAHSAYPLSRDSAQTTASMVAHLSPEVQTYWATGTAAPCASLFKPIRFEGSVLPDIGPIPGKAFDPDTLWWGHEKLHRAILEDFPARSRAIRADLVKTQQSFLETSQSAAPGKHFEVTKKAFKEARGKDEAWFQQVAKLPIKRKNNWIYNRYWSGRNKLAAIE